MLAVGRDEDDRRGRLQRTQGMGQGQPVRARHVDVQKHHVHRVALQRGLRKRGIGRLALHGDGRRSAFAQQGA